MVSLTLRVSCTLLALATLAPAGDLIDFKGVDFNSDEPVVHFDLPPSVVAREVIGAEEVAPLAAGERLVTVELPVSVLVRAGNIQRVEEIIIEVDGSVAGLAVHDYSPATRLESEFTRRHRGPQHHRERPALRGVARRADTPWGYGRAADAGRRLRADQHRHRNREACPPAAEAGDRCVRPHQPAAGCAVQVPPVQSNDARRRAPAAADLHRPRRLAGGRHRRPLPRGRRTEDSCLSSSRPSGATRRSGSRSASRASPSPTRSRSPSARRRRNQCSIKTPPLRRPAPRRLLKVRFGRPASRSTGSDASVASVAASATMRPCINSG